LVAACHCLDYQRRTGAPFGVGAFCPVDAVAISGTPKEFTPRCSKRREGPHLLLPKLRVNDLLEGRQPLSLIDLAVGALADPKYPASVRSVFEQSKHSWVQIDAAVEHFPQGSVARDSN
jgi:hypothetical protein